MTAIVKLCIGCCLFTLFHVCTVFGISWLTTRHCSSKWKLTSSCSKSRKECGFLRHQVKLCAKHLELMPSVSTASIQAMSTCQKIMADRRWNCSSIALAPHFMPDINRDTREQAFVYALASASLVSALSRSCASGHVFSCSCGIIPKAAPRGEFQWGGCADNLKHGMTFSKKFLEISKKKIEKLKFITDPAETGREILKHLIQRHNNQAGRRAVRATIQIQCKCHGVSGACTTKNCWRAIAPLDVIGQYLRKRYFLAAEVVFHRIGQMSMEKLLPVNTQLGMFTQDDLIYVTKSPDFCSRDLQAGSYGTVGRVCNSTSDKSDGCRSMCCGRGHVTYLVEKLERCHCKHYWCCYVKCKTCSSWIEVNQCK